MNKNQKSEIRNQKSLDEAERNQKSEIRNQKSLDEVIEQHEYCLAIGESACGGCRYRDKDGVCRMRENALPYLKAYKSDKEELDSTRMAYIDVLTDHVALKQYWAEQQENPPLTWDELKEMGGKPVWVVEEGYQTWEYWSLVYWMKDDELTLLNENGLTTYSKNEQGTVWQAYRKERG